VARGLLAGDEIIRVWKAYYAYRLKNTSQTGLYFIFYHTSKDQLAPVYVGKGRLLDRVTLHLGAGQYVDQLLAVHFGGIHSRPWLLDESIRARFESLSVGLTLANSPEMDRLERAFIAMLRPAANEGV
jgi:hypothetical protein